MPFFLEFVAQAILFTTTQLAIVFVVYPLASIPLIVIMVLFYVVNNCSHRGILESRKLDNITKSPVVNDLSTVMSGIPLIRGYQREFIFQKR